MVLNLHNWYSTTGKAASKANILSSSPHTIDLENRKRKKKDVRSLYSDSKQLSGSFSRAKEMTTNSYAYFCIDR